MSCPNRTKIKTPFLSVTKILQICLQSKKQSFAMARLPQAIKESLPASLSRRSMWGKASWTADLRARRQSVPWQMVYQKTKCASSKCWRALQAPALATHTPPGLSGKRATPSSICAPLIQLGPGQAHAQVGHATASQKSGAKAAATVGLERTRPGASQQMSASGRPSLERRGMAITQTKATRASTFGATASLCMFLALHLMATMNSMKRTTNGLTAQTTALSSASSSRTISASTQDLRSFFFLDFMVAIVL